MPKSIELDWAGGCWLQCQQPLHCAFIQVIKKVGGVFGTGCKGELASRSRS